MNNGNSELAMLRLNYDIEKLKQIDEIGYLKSVLGQIKDLAMCVVDCECDCDHCMQGQIHQLVKEALNGRED